VTAVRDGCRSWVLDLPDEPYPTPNRSDHWAKKAGMARAWRHNTAILARHVLVPRCDKVHVTLDYWPPDRRRRDADNLLLVLKHCIDGLRTADVVEDDDPSHVTFAMPVIHEPRDDRRPKWLLTVSEDA
jgi:crossover junction endodeoxyribonuclease RusA